MASSAYVFGMSARPFTKPVFSLRFPYFSSRARTLDRVLLVLVARRDTGSRSS
jgi:hypothetical protein